MHGRRNRRSELASRQSARDGQQGQWPGDQGAGADVGGAEVRARPALDHLGPWLVRAALLALRGGAGAGRGENHQGDARGARGRRRQIARARSRLAPRSRAGPRVLPEPSVLYNRCRDSSAMAPIGKSLVFAGIAIVVVGLALWGLSSVPYIGSCPATSTSVAATSASTSRSPLAFLSASPRPCCSR